MIDIDIPAVLALLKAHAWIGLAALLVGLLVRLLKSDVPITPTIPARYRPFLALALGQVAAVLDHVASGTPWKDAAIGGFLAAVVAMLGHEAAIEKLRGGQEVGAPKPEAMVPMLLLVFLAAAPTGCGAAAAPSLKPAVATLDKIGASVDEGEVALHDRYLAAQRACAPGPAGDPCVAGVRARWMPVWDSYRGVRASWLAADNALAAVEAVKGSKDPAVIMQATGEAVSAVRAVTEAQDTFLRALAAVSP